ncbi:MAG: GTP-binding protein [Candidatus Marsarchaeota archaeon]|nr:GTP-binding protein [Candidatus Marsarchaeota archaeon]MCL5115212.1 GTP-binding protein [Candidatus Marsarchaeota archaeon]
MIVRNITLLGHKDHGKSTLIGNLLMLTNSVTQIRIKEAQKYSKRLHKDFEPAFILDSFHEEREHGLTMDITRAEIAYKDVAFSFIDVPGHEELIKNMISGASYASTALLLVSAQKDEGIRDQTKRHLFIAKMIGINHLVVAVNKMDSVGFGEGSFEDIKNRISGFIGKMGFQGKNVVFVPVSAYKGDNLVKKSKNMKWYRGKPLLDLIYEKSGHSGAKNDGALRIVLQGFLDGRRNLVTGRIVRGHIKIKEKGTCIVPLDVNVSVKGIIVKGRRVKGAKVGENVALELEEEIADEVRGSIMCGELYCPIPKDLIKARVFLTRPIGKSLSIRFNGVEISCKSIKPIGYIDPTTGETSKTGRMAGLSVIDAEVKLSKRIPAERFEDTPELGRFVLYSGKEFAGIGTVL